MDGCEAMIAVYTGVWTRCWRKPTERHHLLTRARGGSILDKAKETYHIARLCHIHHRMADGGDAYAGGLLIDGYVVTEGDRVVYYGTDEYLSAKYPSARAAEPVRDQPGGRAGGPALPHDRY